MTKFTFFTSIIFMFFLQQEVKSQDVYVMGNKSYCNLPENLEDRERYYLGLECIKLNQYIGAANKIFQDLIKKDSTFCDAYYWAGYTFRLSKMDKEAAVMYYMADSLSNNKSIEFKQNLAMISLVLDNVPLARKKYMEMTKYFPYSPEGFYGIALTSTVIGDVDFGIENVDIAMKIYKKENKDCLFIKGILLTIKGAYQESLYVLEKVKSKFSKEDYFKEHYSLSLLEVGQQNNDDKMIKKAKKIFENIGNKNELSDEVRKKFGL